MHTEENKHDECVQKGEGDPLAAAVSQNFVGKTLQ